MIVSRCSSLSVAHFLSSKKAKLTVTHNIYWSPLKSLSRSAATPFPKTISNFRPRNDRQGGKNLLFLGFCHYYQDGVQLAKLALLVWAVYSVFYWNRAELVSYSVTGMIYRPSFVQWPMRSVTSTLRYDKMPHQTHTLLSDFPYLQKLLLRN